MPATKQQQQSRFAATKTIIKEHGGIEAINALPPDELKAARKQMVTQLVTQFAHEQMKRQTAYRYVDKVLAGEGLKKRGGAMKGGGLPKGTRKCQSCGHWNVEAVKGNEPWSCVKCGAENFPDRYYVVKP